MGRSYNRYDDWNSHSDDAEYDESDEYGIAPYEQQQGLMNPDEAGQGMPSLVGVSATVTNYGAPLLSYTKTMSRFYQLRKQVLSLGRFKCNICNERISGWAWCGPDSSGYAHDGCYDRLAWAWASVYAEQQRLNNQGDLE
jgi:hypothetical protein